MTPEQSKTLTRVEQKLNDMCVSNTREHLEIKGDIKRAEDKLDNRVKPQLFYWVLGGVFFVLFLFGIRIADNKWDLEKHIDKARDAFHQITGEEYVPPENLKR